MPRTLQSDLNCLGCGYNLRTLHLDGVCPECGRKVAWSLDGHRMILAPTPRQRWCLLWGPRTISLAALLALLTQSWRINWENRPFPEAYPFAFSALLFAIGTWWATVAIHRLDGPVIGPVLRVLARSLAFSPVLSAVFWEIGYAWVRWDHAGPWLRVAEFWMAPTFLALACVCEYTARIARGMSWIGMAIIATLAAIGFASVTAMLLVASIHLGPFNCLLNLIGFGTLGLITVPLLLLLWPGCVADMDHESR